MKDLWDHHEPVGKTPRWVESDITGSDLEAICQGGCASGAYMPAVTYATAMQTMQEHGDAIMQFIEDRLGEVPSPPKTDFWGGMACHYVSTAVELWASERRDEVMAEIEE